MKSCSPKNMHAALKILYCGTSFDITILVYFGYVGFKVLTCGITSCIYIFKLFARENACAG